MEYITGALLLVSVSANTFLLYLLKTQKKAKPVSLTAEALLHDLTRGQALVRIEPIDPSNILLRSPRT